MYIICFEYCRLLYIVSVCICMCMSFCLFVHYFCRRHKMPLILFIWACQSINRHIVCTCKMGYLCSRYWRSHSISIWRINLTRFGITFIKLWYMRCTCQWGITIRYWFVTWRMCCGTTVVGTIIGCIISAFAIVSTRFAIDMMCVWMISSFFATSSRPTMLQIIWNSFIDHFHTFFLSKIHGHLNIWKPKYLR